MKTIGLSDITFKKVCGFGKEREKPGVIKIDVEIETDFSNVAVKDDPEYGIDVKKVYKLISMAMKDEVYTIETMADRVWNNLKNLKNTGKIMVKIKKYEPELEGKVLYSFAKIEK